MKYLVFVLLLAFAAHSVSAQEVYNSSGKPAYKKKYKKKTGYDPDRLILGGGLNGMYATGGLYAGISPIVGYRITKHFSAGLGLGYQYSRETFVDPSVGNWYRKANIVYPSAWTRYFVYRNIFADVTFEYDFITRSIKYKNNGVWETRKNSVTAPCLLVGVGIKQPLGGRVFMFGQLMYDVLQNPNSPYIGVFPRVGIAAGL